MVSQGKHLAGRGLVTLCDITQRPGCLLDSVAVKEKERHAIF